MRKSILFFLFISSGTFVSLHAESLKSVFIVLAAVDTFPIPPASHNMLFYVQRTSNTNTVVYDLNTTTGGALQTTDPIHIYWIRYSEKGQHEELNYVQRNFAYGLNFKPVRSGVYEFAFVSYKKLRLFLSLSETEKKYIVTTMLGTKRVKVNRLFVKIDGGTFWLPKVDFVEIKGIDLSNGTEITERFKP